MANISSGQVITTFTGTLTQGSNIITSIPSVPPYQYYLIVISSGTGSIPPNTFISSTSVNSITMNNAALTNGTATFSVITTNISIQARDYIRDARSITTNRNIGWN